MGQVIIRNLDEDVIASFKFRAELNGKSLEQELRDLLNGAAPLTGEEKAKAAERLLAGQPLLDWDTAAAIRRGRDDEHEPR